MNQEELFGRYGPPGSWMSLHKGHDFTLIGVATEDNLVRIASIVSSGRSVALVDRSTTFRVLPHPENTGISHNQFYQALGISLRSDLTDAEVWNDRGNILYELGWRQESLECFFRALNLNVNYAPAWVNLSRSFMAPERPDFSTAELCAGKALALDARSDMALANLGGISFAKGDLDSAIEYCSRAATINDNNFFAHYYLAGTLMRAGVETDDQKKRVLEHALRCRDLISQFPGAEPMIEQTIAYCQGS